MPRKTEQFSIILRPPSKVYHFKLAGWSNYKSTQVFFDQHRERFQKHLNCKTKADAQEVVRMAITIQEESKRPMPLSSQVRLIDLLKDAYTWDRCPHVRRLRDEGKAITKRHVQDSRNIIKSHILCCKDFVNKPIAKMRRSDVLEFRSFMLDRVGPRTVNKALSIVKAVIREAIFQEVIDRDPTIGVSKVKLTEKKEPGVFTKEELLLMFPEKGIGPWKSITDHTVFLTAASTGMRRSEILALRWENVNLEKQFINVVEAFKDYRMIEIGKPKWERSRVVPIPKKLVTRLKDLRDQSPYAKDSDYVFCYKDGTHLGGTWWSKHFRSACIAIGVIKAKKKVKENEDPNPRNLTPHSFRHTLNTLLLSNGYDSGKIRATLGWTSEKIQDNYTHFSIDHLNGQSDMVESFFEKDKKNGTN
ncbi:tyrosine-type recombinase/integrase [Sediminispirochaeta smaragdinae]|uniref:Integrase family protein n=1 Tax=Sediminispirochaeta smaragdinae (strain DSM 11293 / JCM 15392 / SEBR 4228) TaxID=573413 RepID=E1R8X5_SEDSS|nr:site-specific integrase [Sediminispirochaeta smaragdinae]ADK81882.1 integrase family protein [Sediminispirochaeta smaragdinae DSM 11293]